MFHINPTLTLVFFCNENDSGPVGSRELELYLRNQWHLAKEGRKEGRQKGRELNIDPRNRKEWKEMHGSLTTTEGITEGYIFGFFAARGTSTRCSRTATIRLHCAQSRSVNTDTQRTAVIAAWWARNIFQTTFLSHLVAADMQHITWVSGHDRQWAPYEEILWVLGVDSCERQTIPIANGSCSFTRRPRIASQSWKHGQRDLDPCLDPPEILSGKKGIHGHELKQFWKQIYYSNLIWPSSLLFSNAAMGPIDCINVHQSEYGALNWHQNTEIPKYVMLHVWL